MSAVSEGLLEADRVGVMRGPRRVLGNISAQFHGGAWTAIVGPNGAGKSTLLSTLAGLIRPKEGTVRLAGRPIQDWSDRERAQRLTWFGQSAVSEADIAAHEVVRLGRLPRYGLLGAPTAADEAAVRSALEKARPHRSPSGASASCPPGSASGCCWRERSRPRRPWRFTMNPRYISTLRISGA